MKFLILSCAAEKEEEKIILELKFQWQLPLFSSSSLSRPYPGQINISREAGRTQVIDKIFKDPQAAIAIATKKLFDVQTFDSYFSNIAGKYFAQNFIGCILTKYCRDIFGLSFH